MCPAGERHRYCPRPCKESRARAACTTPSRHSGVHELMIAARPAAILRISGLASAVTGQPPETKARD